MCSHTHTHLVGLVPQRHRSPFLRTPQHQSAAVVVRVAVHHGGGRHRVPEVRSAAQLGATAATRRRRRVKTRRSRGGGGRGARVATITHPSSRELVLLLPCSDSALMVSIWMRSCSCRGRHSARKPAVSRRDSSNSDERDRGGRKPSRGGTPRSASWCGPALGSGRSEDGRTDTEREREDDY